MEAKTSAEGFSGLRSTRAPVEGKMAATPSVARPKERGPRGNFLNAYYDLPAAPRSYITNVSKFCRHANNLPEYEVLYYTNYLSISESLLSLFSPLGCHQASDNEDQARDTLNQFAAIEGVYVSQCLISRNLPRSLKHIPLPYIVGWADNVDVQRIGSELPLGNYLGKRQSGGLRDFSNLGPRIVQPIVRSNKIA